MGVSQGTSRVVGVIANPISGRGRGREGAEALARALAEQGLQVWLACSDGPGGVTALAAALPAEVRTVVAVGGDGTIREVVQGLRDLSVAVGMLPTGTANMLARELALPRDPAGCASLVTRGHTVPFDLARTHRGQRFFMVAGAGFDATCTRSLARRRQGPISKASYVMPVIRSFLGYRHPGLRVTLEEPGGEHRVIVDAVTVVVGNIQTYGGPFELTSYARPASGSLDVLVLTGRAPRLRLALTMVAGVLRVAPLLPGMVYAHATRLRVEGDMVVPYQLDGDPMGETPLEIELEPEPLRILAPPGPR